MFEYTYILNRWVKIVFDLGIGPTHLFGISTRIWISAPVGYLYIMRTAYRRPTPCIIYYYHGMAYLILYYYDIHRYRICYIRVPKRLRHGAGCVYCKYVHRSNHRRITALPPYAIYITQRRYCHRDAHCIDCRAIMWQITHPPHKPSLYQCKYTNPHVEIHISL